MEVSGLTPDEDIIMPPCEDLEQGIYVNGVGSDSHETLVIESENGPFERQLGSRMMSCVICILLRAYMLAPNSFSVR